MVSIHLKSIFKDYERNLMGTIEEAISQLLLKLIAFEMFSLHTF